MSATTTATATAAATATWQLITLQLINEYNRDHDRNRDP